MNYPFLIASLFALNITFISHTTDQLVRDKAAHKTLSYLSFISTEYILDADARDGKIAYDMTQLVPQGLVYGLISSEEKYSSVRDFYAPVPNLRFFNSNASQFMSHSPYDLITIFFTLTWANEPAQILKNLMLSLKEQGLIASTVASKENNLYYKARTELINSTEWSRYFTDYNCPVTLYTQEEISNIFSQANLAIELIETITKPFVFEDKDALADWIKSTTDLNDYVPSDMQEQLINDLVDLYLSNLSSNEDKSIELYLPYIIVIAGR